MEASDRLAMRQQQSRKRKLRMLWCGVALLLIIGALAIGLGVGLTQTLSGGDDGVSEEFGAQIMVPLFNEPVNGSWDPLFTQARAHADLNFTVIVNPKNGGEIATSLSQPYKRALKTLRDIPNVILLGYINTNDSMRPIDQVLAEGREYASWSFPDASGDFGLDGLYYDNVATTKEGEGESNYLELLDWAVKNGTDFGSKRMVVHNTREVPDYFDDTTDITIVFDGTYGEYREKRSSLADLEGDMHSKLGIIVRNMPTTDVNITEVVKDMSRIAGHLYLTDLTADDEPGLGSNWEAFVEAMASLDR